MSGRRKTITVSTIIVAVIYLMAAQIVKAPYELIDGWRVIDGDTLEIQTRHIRLWGIDAPELHQNCLKGHEKVKCGEQAKQALFSLLRTDKLQCQAVDTDRYQRQVSKCKVGDQDVGSAMVRQGWAVDYDQYSNGTYVTDQSFAKNNHLGVWAYRFEMPAQWRHGHRRY